MKTKLILILALLIIPFAYADVNTTISITTNDGDSNNWVYSNSGNGTTNYYLDGVDYKESLMYASNRRSSIPTTISSAFMVWTYRKGGRYGWEETDFSRLSRPFQRLRYVFDTWFVPRAELKQIIKKQQAQITQLQFEVQAIEKVINDEQLCKARQKIMIEQDLEYVTCNGVTYHNDKDIGLISISKPNKRGAIK